MKKVILTLVLGLCFGLVSSAQQSNEDYGPDAKPIKSSCWEGCVSVMERTGPRQPSENEMRRAQEYLDNWCSSKPVVLLSPA